MASPLPRVQREVSGQPVSLGSYSEAQHLTDPVLLERAFGERAGPIQGPSPPQRAPSLATVVCARPRRHGDNPRGEFFHTHWTAPAAACPVPLARADKRGTRGAESRKQAVCV